MNRSLLILCGILISAMMLFGGCSGNTDVSDDVEDTTPMVDVGESESEAEDVESPSQESTGIPGMAALLDGYPQDLLPLVETARIDYCTFTVRYDDTYNLGRNFYMFSYRSGETLQELFDYYKSLLTEIDPDFNEPDWFRGSIGGQPVNISLIDEGDGTTVVDIGVGMKQEDYVTENPYFDLAPLDYAEVPPESALVEQKHDRVASQYEDLVSVNCSECYETDLSLDEIKAFYDGKYDDKPGYGFEEDEYSITYYWKVQDDTVEVYISKGTEYVSNAIFVEVFGQK